MQLRTQPHGLHLEYPSYGRGRRPHVESRLNPSLQNQEIPSSPSTSPHIPLSLTPPPMPKTPKDLAYSQAHVVARAAERYPTLAFTESDYVKLNSKILLGKSEGVDLLNEEGDEQIWGVRWDGVEQGAEAAVLVCVWSRALGRVTTLLPEGMVVKRKKGRCGK